MLAWCLPAAGLPAAAIWPRPTRSALSTPTIAGNSSSPCATTAHSRRPSSRGERIAQFILTPYLTAQFFETETLTDTARGEGGFGSTGAK